MAFCLFELSQNPAVQERLYQEVKDVLESHNGQLDYEALQEMTYMDQVINGKTKSVLSFTKCFLYIFTKKGYFVESKQ